LVDSLQAFQAYSSHIIVGKRRRTAEHFRDIE
jgi:hypothetical protein